MNFFNLVTNIAPPETAKYLVKVSEDAALFASYFWWRDFYRPSQAVKARYIQHSHCRL